MSNLSTRTYAKAIFMLAIGLGFASMAGPSNMILSKSPPLHREYMPNSKNVFHMDDLHIIEHRTYEFAFALKFSTEKEKLKISEKIGVLNPRNSMEAGLEISAKVTIRSSDGSNNFSIDINKVTKGVNISGADFLARSIGYANLKPGAYVLDIQFSNNIDAFKNDKVSIFVLYDQKTMSEK